MTLETKLRLGAAGTFVFGYALAAFITLQTAYNNWHDVMPDNIVAYMYTYTCEECDYELAEGDYSIVSQQGFEFCPECHEHREYQAERESALFKK